MSADPRVIDLVLRWEELHGRGQTVPAEELCRNCPELLPEVRRGLADLQALHALVGTGSEGPTDTPAADAEAPVWVVAAGRYRPSRFHAQGGLGEVHVAEDTELGRPVALKRIRPPLADREDSRRRFLREAAITARLQHPGIVPVYGLTHDEHGRPCYAMRFVEGQSLKEAIERYHAADPAGRNLALRQLLGRFVAVCKTVAYAHSRGVVHLDLKPGNILLGDFDETLVVDWGLARQTGEGGAAGPVGAPAGDQDTSRVDGYAAGTPAYMSPEQAAGRWDAIGPASDVYSLGATLYAILTGRAPFQGDSGAILRQARRGAFPRPRRVNPAVPQPLEAVCLKAMAPAPPGRYATALELAADVERWLGDEPVSAYREPFTTRLRRWTRRHRTLVVSGASALLLTLLLGGGAGLWLAFREAETRRAVSADLDEADQLQREETWRNALAAVERAEGRLGGGGPADLRERVRQARANLALADRLEEIFLDYATPREVKVFSGAGRAADAYARVFLEYGLDLAHLGPDAAAERVNGSAIRPRLLAALEGWAFASARADRSGWEHLLAVAERVDADPWRRRLREAWVRRDRLTLLQLISQTDIAGLPRESLVALSRALASADHTPEVLRALREVQRRIPGDFQTNYVLSSRLFYGTSSQQKAESVAFVRAALALRPTSAFLHLNLATTLRDLGHLDEAEAVFRAALRLDPGHSIGHGELGWTLWLRGQKAQAEQEYRTALRLDPENAWARNNLAYHLINQGKLDEALAECTAAIRSQPDYFRPHFNRCDILTRRQKWADLEAAARAWLRAIPDSPEALARLAFALDRQEKWAAAAALYAGAFADRPRLVADPRGGHRYQAACAAAMAGSGQGDGADLDAAERARHRRLALAWLRADLRAWQDEFQRSTPVGRAAVAQALRGWQTEARLARLRDPAAVALLAAPEQAACRELWAGVANLLKQP